MYDVECGVSATAVTVKEIMISPFSSIADDELYVVMRRRRLRLTVLYVLSV